MEKRNSLTLTLDQPFVAGTDDFSPFYNRLHKLNCAIILIAVPAVVQWPSI